jgi:hypothetical protein
VAVVPAHRRLQRMTQVLTGGEAKGQGLHDVYILNQRLARVSIAYIATIYVANKHTKMAIPTTKNILMTIKNVRSLVSNRCGKVNLPRHFTKTHGAAITIE